MKAYLCISGLVFVLIFGAHVLRILSEGPGLVLQSTFLFTSVVSLSLGIWSVILLRGVKGRADR